MVRWFLSCCSFGMFGFFGGNIRRYFRSSRRWIRFYDFDHRTIRHPDMYVPHMTLFHNDIYNPDNAVQHRKPSSKQQDNNQTKPAKPPPPPLSSPTNIANISFYSSVLSPVARERLRTCRPSSPRPVVLVVTKNFRYLDPFTRCPFLFPIRVVYFPDK